MSAAGQHVQCATSSAHLLPSESCVAPACKRCELKLSLHVVSCLGRAAQPLRTFIVPKLRLWASMTGPSVPGAGLGASSCPGASRTCVLPLPEGLGSTTGPCPGVLTRPLLLECIALAAKQRGPRAAIEQLSQGC